MPRSLALFQAAIWTVHVLLESAGAERLAEIVLLTRAAESKLFPTQLVPAGFGLAVLFMLTLQRRQSRETSLLASVYT